MTDDSLQQTLDGLRQTFWIPTQDEQPEGLLYHYTGSAGFHGILKSRCIRATAYDHLNDPSEMKYGEDSFVEVAKTLCLDSTIPKPQRGLLENVVLHYELGKLTNLFTPYIASFTGQGGNVLSQWEQYGAKGTGYSIGFAGFGSLLDHVEEAPTAAWRAQCHYGSDWFQHEARNRLLEMAQAYVAAWYKHKPGNQPVEGVKELADDIATEFVLSAFHLAATLVPRTKSPGWESEQEYRLIIVPVPGQKDVVEERPGPSGPIRYIPLQLAEDRGLLDIGCVYVGPNNDDAAGTIDFLNELGYEGEKLVLPSQVS